MNIQTTTIIFLFTTSIVIAGNSKEGYVLQAENGEYAAGAKILVSPQTGSQGGVLMLEPFPEGFSTGMHYHLEADEFFFVLEGKGTAILGDKKYKVTEGDVIFVPAGLDHKLESAETSMKLLVFLDKPGLEEEFRAWHRKYGDQAPESLEQLNSISKKYGTVYKTIE